MDIEKRDEFESIVKGIAARVADPKFHIQFQCIRSVAFRDPGYFQRQPKFEDMIQIGTDDEALLHVLQSGGHSRLEQRCRPITTNGPRQIQIPARDISYIHQELERIGKEYDRHLIATISLEDWNRMTGSGATLDFVTLTFDSAADRSRVFRELARMWPLPPQCLSFKRTWTCDMTQCSWTRVATSCVKIYLSKRIVLFRAYIALHDLFRYDMAELDRHVSLLNAAYDKSIESFDHKAPKIDYELVVLGSFGPLGRNCTDAEAAVGLPAGRYGGDTRGLCGGSQLGSPLFINAVFAEPCAPTLYLPKPVEFH